MSLCSLWCCLLDYNNTSHSSSEKKQVEACLCSSGSPYPLQSQTSFNLRNHVTSDSQVLLLSSKKFRRLNSSCIKLTLSQPTRRPMGSRRSGSRLWRPLCLEHGHSRKLDVWRKFSEFKSSSNNSVRIDETSILPSCKFPKVIPL